MLMQCHTIRASLTAAMKSNKLCREVLSYSPDNAKLDHLTNVMKEIAQQKLKGIKERREDSDLNEMILYIESHQLPEDAAVQG